jgi:hypothetical protein
LVIYMDHTVDGFLGCHLPSVKIACLDHIYCTIYRLSSTGVLTAKLCE